MWSRKQVHQELRRRSRRIIRNVCSGDTVRSKQSVTIESLISWQILIELIIRLQGRSSALLWHIDPKLTEWRNVLYHFLTRALKMYITDVDQKNSDEYAERLTFALSTSQDRVRGDKPFYLINEWDSRSTLGATLLWGVPSDAMWHCRDGGIIKRVNISVQELQWMMHSKLRSRIELNDIMRI